VRLLKPIKSESLGVYNHIPEALSHMNRTKSKQFRILRYKPGVMDPPRYQTFEVVTGPGYAETVLDGLEQIRQNQDPTLMYRHSCHHSSCGTCACQINGIPQLSCITKLKQLEGDPVMIEPLGGFDCQADLVVNMEDFFEHIDPNWSYCKTDRMMEAEKAQKRITSWSRLEDCIECGCCVSACPEARENSPFMGPAALAATHRQYAKNKEGRRGLLAVAGGDAGVKWCKRVWACSKVCPTRVNPGRHIKDLRRLLKNNNSSF